MPQLSRRQQLVQHRAKELLLPSDAREVGDAVAGQVPRPHVGQGGAPVERVAAGLRDVEPR